MIYVIKIMLLIFGSVALQTTLIAHISIFGSKPDLPLALTVSIALFRGSMQGESVGFASGLLCDLASGGPFIGIQSFSKVLVGYSIGLLKIRFYSDNIITQLLSGFTAAMADKLIVFLCLVFLNFPFPHIRFWGLILTAAISSVFVPIIYVALKGLKGLK